MNGIRVCTCLLLILLVAAGCQQTELRQAAVAEPVSEPVPVVPMFTTATLSAEQLMSLDWDGKMAGRPTVQDKRIVGTGVEFDIRFPGNKAWSNSMDYLSSGGVGQGALAGLDVERYEAFALKFKLVSVGGRTDPNRPLQVAVGAVVGPAGNGRMTASMPVTLTASSEATVATTPIRTRRLHVVGIHAHVVNPQTWGLEGGTITLSVEPASEAEVLASPAPASEDQPPTRVAQTGQRKPRPASVRKTEPKADGPSASAKPPQRKRRTKSASAPDFGTKRVGAW